MKLFPRMGEFIDNLPYLSYFDSNLFDFIVNLKDFYRFFFKICIGVVELLWTFFKSM